MKKIRVNAQAIVGDIKKRVGLKSLMEKHGLSYPSLLKTRDILLDKGLVTRGDLEYLHLANSSAQKTVPAKEFLAVFRNRPDDFHLMDSFQLTAKDLRKIYDRLIQAGLLSEYEYHCRDRKAPELEEAVTNLCETSTEVTLLRSVFDGGWGADGIDPEILPEGLHSHRVVADKSPSTKRGSRKSSPPAGSTGDVNEETTLAVCPNCGCPSDDSSPNACLCCGIVFSKIKGIPAKRRTPIWQFDYGMR